MSGRWKASGGGDQRGPKGPGGRAGQRAGDQPVEPPHATRATPAVIADEGSFRSAAPRPLTRPRQGRPKPGQDGTGGGDQGMPGRVSFPGPDRRRSGRPPTAPHPSSWTGAAPMWVRQCDLDAEADDLPPIPSRIASNEEFVPPPQSAEQRQYEDRLARLGCGRRGSARGAPDATSSAAAVAWPPPCWPSTRSSATATRSTPMRSRTPRRSRSGGPRTSSSSTSRPTTSMSAASGTTTRAPAAASRRSSRRSGPRPSPSSRRWTS